MLASELEAILDDMVITPNQIQICDGDMLNQITELQQDIELDIERILENERQMLCDLWNIIL
jgi:hypothetical protein